MWKYVSRRIRDTFERSANHFDRRSATIVNPPNATFADDKEKRASPCQWFYSRKCWNSFQEDNDTNNKRWNFEHLNRTWIGAITWSSALVAGWYTSQLLHLKLKYLTKDQQQQKCPHLKNILSTHNLYAPVNQQAWNPSSIQEIVSKFTPTVHLTSNDTVLSEKSSSSNSADTSSSNSDNVFGDVLNSIENKLGLAAIESGQYQDGLNLLRSAANRKHAPALYNLGLCYERGLGVEVNEKIAMGLYRTAAELNHPGALYNLGIYYGQGRGGLSRDVGTATRLLRLAAIQGQQEAKNALKSLETTEVPEMQNPDSWSYTPYVHGNIIPSHTTLFVQNVNYHQEYDTVY